jgi:hypothetical protein
MLSVLDLVVYRISRLSLLICCSLPDHVRTNQSDTGELGCKRLKLFKGIPFDEAT